MVWGEDDVICDHDKGKRFFEGSENTQFVSVPGCGHALFVDPSKQFLVKAVAPLAREFLFA